MPNQLRLRFTLPTQVEPLFFRRETSVFVDGRHISQPELTSNALEAHRFNSESAVAFRDHYREQYRRNGYEIVIEDAQGNVLFERDIAVSNDGEDNRVPVWFSPDDLVEQRLGFVVRPGIRPDIGKVWFVRCSDFPSIVHRNFDSVFGRTPQEAVERARTVWAPLIQPIPHPNQAAIDAERARVAQEAHGQYPGVRSRPGNPR
jgi:hypothetical protein